MLDDKCRQCIHGEWKENVVKVSKICSSSIIGSEKISRIRIYCYKKNKYINSGDTCDTWKDNEASTIEGKTW